MNAWWGNLAWDNVVTWFDWWTLGWGDVVQIAILYGVFYSVLKVARGSRFGQVLMGVGVLFGSLIAFTYIFHFDVLSYIIRGVLFYLALSSVVIFHSEIRRFLEQIGTLIRNRDVSRGSKTVETYVQATLALAGRKMGALLAFERGISLKGYETSGVTLDAWPSTQLLVTIFTPPLPLHDGGVVVRQGRLAAAHCLFPVSNLPALSISGMRHRAAVGLSEETDALIVVVSEETGCISLARNGKLKRLGPADREETKAELTRRLEKVMRQEKTPVDRIGEFLRGRALQLKRRGK